MDDIYTETRKKIELYERYLIFIYDLLVHYIHIILYTKRNYLFYDFKYMVA